jgi:demethylmenaquinone methyltransferase / 2-methoxy-6-polyprenyl-1,4-benzoquinol methylase
VLDVATGTGDLALMLKRASPAGGGGGRRLRRGDARRGTRQGASTGLDLELCSGDALALPFETEPSTPSPWRTGCATSPTSGGACAEMRRVLRPGGRLVVLEFPPPPANLIGTALRWYGRTVMPRIGGWLSGDRSAYAYLPASTGVPRAGALRRRPARRRFGEVRYRLQTFGISALHVGVAA